MRWRRKNVAIGAPHFPPLTHFIRLYGFLPSIQIIARFDICSTLMRVLLSSLLICQRDIFITSESFVEKNGERMVTLRKLSLLPAYSWMMISCDWLQDFIIMLFVRFRIAVLLINRNI